MKVMNKLKANEIQLVKNAKESFQKAKTIQKKNGSGLASWNDDWACFSDGHRIDFTFSRWGNALSSDRYDLARAFALEQLNRNINSSDKRSSVQYACRAINMLSVELCEVEQSELNTVTNEFVKAGFSTKLSGSFWGWCKKKELLPDFLKTPSHVDNRDRSAEEYDERNSKLITDEQVAAVGVLFNELFSEKGLRDYGFKSYSREYIAVAFCTLALSTPSRGDAEIWALPCQRVKTHVNGETGEETHSLFWKGSKGFPDNRTHILSGIQHNVDEVLRVLEEEFLPGKILSFFMANPTSSLNLIMARYPEFEYKTEKYSQLNLKDPTNIFHLGLVLGFYYDDPVVPVLGEHNISIKVHHSTKWKQFKYLSELKNEEEIGYHHSIESLYRFNKVKVSVSYISFVSKGKALFQGENKTSLKKLTNFIISGNVFLNGSIDTIVRGKDVSTKVEDAFFVIFGWIHWKSSRESDAFKNKKKVALPSMYELNLAIKRPQMSRVWIEEALRLIGLESMAFTPHQLRHWVNHHAKESGIPISIINLWSGRKDADQAYEYIHTTDEDNARQISSVLVTKKDMQPSTDIKMISIEKIKGLSKLPASVMSEGICTQDLVTMPCRFLNDFMTSCFGCQAMCYIRGDEKVLVTLKLDLDMQMKRLGEVQKHKGFLNNKASQEWYRAHFNKTSVLKALIDVLEDDSIPEGSSVRITDDLNCLELRVQNLDTAQIDVRQLVLEDANKSLNTLIVNTETSSTAENHKLTKLLSAHGLSYDKN